MSSLVTIHTYGTARNNPGNAGIGIVVYGYEETPLEFSENIGIASSVQAQYQAIIRALSWACDNKIANLEVFLNNAALLRDLQPDEEVSDLAVLGLHKQLRRLAENLNVTFSLYKSAFPDRAAILALEGSMKSSENAKIAPPTTPNERSEQRHAIQQSAGGVVYKKEGRQIKVCLISKKDGSFWALPKGRVQSGESWEAAAIREILEETGHLTTISDHIDQIEYFFYWKENQTLYYKIVSFFLMPLITENAAPRDDEALAVNWFPIGEAWRRLYYQSEKNILRQAQGILKAANI